MFGEENTVGEIEEVARISRESVPRLYPVNIRTQDALKFTVSLETGDETDVYMEWPDEFTDETPLVSLLASLNLHPSRFADLLGEEIPLKRIEGKYVLDLPNRSMETTHSSYWVWGITVGLASWILLWLVLNFVPAAGGVMLLTWVLLPVVTYFDIQYVRETSEWNPRKIMWPVLAAVWLINIPALLYYLHKRKRVLGPFWE